MPYYDIAGLCVSMDARYPLTVSRAEPYLANRTDAVFSVTGNGNEFEEYAELALSFYQQVLQYDGFLLHSSTVEYDGKAVAFSASSGVGKSTHSSYWQRELGAEIINDDKPVIRLIDDVPCACGTPFSGKAALSRNVCVPLYAIVFLTRAEKTVVRRLNAEEAVYRLLSQTLRPTDIQQYDRLLQLLERVLELIPVYEAGVPNDPLSASEVKTAIGL